MGLVLHDDDGLLAEFFGQSAMCVIGLAAEEAHEHGEGWPVQRCKHLTAGGQIESEIRQQWKKKDSPSTIGERLRHTFAEMSRQQNRANP
ncbi:hypothetical protein ASF62_12215 [Leifsonia sp. Leaf325]|nr:hypothetical protein ASF62_12215 [Leifsonia sp. Leaf325]